MKRSKASRTPKTPVPEGGFPAAPADLNHELTRGFTGRLVRRKSRQLVGRFHLTASDRPDIEQDLCMRVVRRRRRFDPAKGHWKAFVTTIVERGVASLIEARRWQKSEHVQEIVSLSTKVRGEDNEQIELSRQILPEHQSAVTGCYRLSDHQRVELAHDVAVVRATLTPKLRRLCDCLKTTPLPEICQQMRISPTTLRRRLCALRTAFERAGLDGLL